ncbi:MAG: IscS subfamily cysteine desulfurase [Alphaproteobacteria bacterium]
MVNKKSIYFDYQATTPTDPRVVKEMQPYFFEKFGNPHSRSHAYGWEAEEAVEKAREQVASVIGASSKEIVFTSGATESNNLALKGLAKFYGDEKKHIITVSTEHKCVIDTCRQLEEEGFRVTYLPVQKDGLIDLAKLKEAISEDTMVISVMAANNEIGVLQPLKEIGEIAREYGIFFHTDAAQAFGKIPLDVEEMNIDLMSISSHKIYGPKGIGALYVRRRPRVRILAQIHGGGQERGMRSGTLATPLIVGFGVAAELAQESMQSESERLKSLQEHMLNRLNAELDEIYVNGSLKHRLPNSLNISFGFIEGESLMMSISDIAVSSGSACTSASLEPSYVLNALNVSDEMAHSSLRMSFGRWTTKEEIDYACDRLIKEVKRLRELSPLWEMHLAGIDLSTIQWAEH